MYYPSFFTNVRPYETLHARERVDNPLDLSVKQAVGRPEGPLGPDHDDIQLLMEQRKLAVAGLPSRPLGQQMPLLDSMYGYKPFGSDPQSCQIPGTATSLLSQSLGNPYCTTGSPGSAVNHLGLIPGLMQPNRDTLTLDAPPPPLTPYPIDPSSIPYHMRINSVAAAAMAINSANQRAFYGHGTVLAPHIASSFGGSLPHISLYSDLLSDMTRRPVEPEKGVFAALPSMRSPAEPTTRFSDHLQRLREQHLQQSKCSGPCCLPSPGHGSGAQNSSSHHISSATHTTNGCNCCNIPLAMPNNVSPLMIPSSHTTTPVSVPVSVSMACKDVCNREMMANTNSLNNNHENNIINNDHKNNNNNNNNNSSFIDNSCNINRQPIEPKESNESQHRSHLQVENHTLQKHDIKYVSSLHSHPKPQLWNPSQSNQPLVLQSDYRNNVKQTMSCTRNDNIDKESEKCGAISAKILSDNENNNNSIKRNISNESHISNANIFINKETVSSNESISNKSIKSVTISDTGFSQIESYSGSSREVITIDEDSVETKTRNVVLNKTENRSLSPTLLVAQNSEKLQNNNTCDIFTTNKSDTTIVTDIPTMTMSTSAKVLASALATSISSASAIAASTTTTTAALPSMAYNNNKVGDSLNQSNAIMERTKSPQARTHENQVGNSVGKSDGSYDNNILSSKSVANSALNDQTIDNVSHSMNANARQNIQNIQQRTGAQPQQSNEIKLSQLKSYFGGGGASALRQQKQEIAHQNDHQIHSEFTQKTSQESAISVKSNASASNSNSNSNITKQLKDYKLLPKNQNINAIDKNKRQPKETKTVEVQCDGPDWTPIVLPATLKSKLQKVVRRKMSCSESKNNSTTKQLMNHKKDSKKRKKCKQKHTHRSHSRSRSSSSSTVSSRRSSPERKRHLSSYCDVSTGKSRKRSMLQCLVNSEGYVADKIKKTSREQNLFASDPSQLGREERALQRAMKHFEELQKPSNSDNTVKNSAEDYTTPLNNNNSNNINENKNYKINTGSSNCNNECEKSKNNTKKHQKLIESVDSETKIKKQPSDSSKSNRKSKKSTENEDFEEVVTTDLMESSKKMDAKAKRRLRQRILEKLLHDKSEDEETPELKCSKKKKTKVNNKSDDRVEKIDEKIDEKTSQENHIQCKQKKAIVSVRRRRFRSGLDMIRHPHRRKKSRVNHIQGSNARNREESTNHPGSDLKTNEEASHKSNSESGNASLPTEMKRLMVNKALGETLLHRASRSNRKDVVNFCLQSNTCDINARDNAGYTPLHECSTRGNLEIARTLLQNNADVNASAAGGIRPLHDAVENNHIEVVRLLLAYGADPNISTYSGSTPLKLARSKAMVQFLKGFLVDISGDSQFIDSKEKVLPWKFNSSSNFLDTNQTGFNVFDGLPSDGDEEESDDFLFEVSDTPLDPTYRLPNSCTKGSSNFLRLSDVLRRTCLTKDEFVKKHSNIEIVSIARHELDNATISQLLTTSRLEQHSTNDCYTVDVVHLDDNIRNILGIETVRLR